MPPDFVVELFCLVQNAARTREESVSRRREFHAFGTAHEKWRSEGLFEVGESLAYRGGNRVTALSGPRDAADLCDRDKLLEIAEVKVQGAFPDAWPEPVRT